MTTPGTEIMTLDVGGVIYRTSRNTLTRYPESMLGIMFSGRVPVQKDGSGRYFIDRNGDMFKYVLDFLRTSKLCVPHDFKEYDQLAADAEFYQIEELIEAVRIQRFSEFLSVSLEYDRSAGFNRREIICRVVIRAREKILSELEGKIPSLSNHSRQPDMQSMYGPPDLEQLFAQKRVLDVYYSAGICKEEVFEMISESGFRYLSSYFDGEWETERFVFHRKRREL